MGRIVGPAWGGYTFDALGLQWPFLTAGFFMPVAFLLSLKNLLRSNRQDARDEALDKVPCPGTEEVRPG